jgi:putative DNA primase/helicase
MRLADVARIWQQAGVSVVPILDNRTKRPAIKWGDYTVAAPTLGQVDEWWGNGKTYGLALVCGAVSGGLEMLEVEGRACDGESLSKIQLAVNELGIGDIWDLLQANEGYSEMSPSGGLHFLYRISDHEVPGNQKIASTEENLVLAETRGEGGYVIVAPTAGSCHPSGEPWTIISGTYGTLPTITWEQRCLVHQAISMALDRSPAPPEAPALLPVPPPRVLSGAGLSPGDHFEATTDWAEILEPHGWTLESRHGPERHWTRPGKDRKDGGSATTGHAQDRDRLFVFSTSTVFHANTSYTKFAAYTELNFSGDFRSAALDLKRKGYGFSEPVQDLDVLPLPAMVEVPGPSPRYEASDDGNAQYLYDRIKGQFHWLAEERDYIFWDGVKWARDQKLALEWQFVLMAREKVIECRAAGDEVGAKWWVKAGNRARIETAIKSLRAVPGFSVVAAELNQDDKLINVANGTLDLTNGQLGPHDPERLMTRVMGAAYDPQATCPEFEGFMERVVPEAGMRAYVQRALGYSMLGEADQRSLFLICGPSGTGKSTLMATMELVFGDYGVSAPSGTLRAAGRETSSPSNDLHTLMGKRFVSTSETNEHTAYNEDLIKRLTGRDTVSSRRLYQDFQDWSPRCAIWLATNHPPKFNSDDDAIWRRAKLVPFNTVLLGEGQVSDFAHNVLAKERDGILNWLLVGLKDYQAHGLQEPEEVLEAAHEVRLQSDPVARFLEDRAADGILVRDPEQRIRSTELYMMYTEWARQVGERVLGSRRVTHRIMSNYRDLDNVRVGGYYYWRGIGRGTGASILGSFAHGLQAAPD